MAIPNPTTPLLLTKRLTAFLHANQSAQLPTLLLTTSQGKLLAHASPHPVSVLRTHATVAGSLLAIHTSSSVALPSALHKPSLHDDPTDDEEEEEEAVHSQDEENYEAIPKKLKSTSVDKAVAPSNSVKPITITVQLSQGTVIIRRLKCGLLFVCIGPSASDPSADATGGLDLSFTDAATAVTAVVGSASDADSLVSMGAQTTSSIDSTTSTSVVAMRRHVSELARWLDDRLGTLKVPEESGGMQ